MNDCKNAHESLIKTLAFIEACGLSKTPEWKSVTKAIKKFLNKEAGNMTQVYENLSREREIINLNDPSIKL